MEFRHRVGDNKPETPMASTANPVSSITHVSQQSLQGVPDTFQMPVAGEAFRRELEKEQIRREIIAAGEIARRWELEEEVRKELAMERALGIRMLGTISFQERERLAMWSNPLPLPLQLPPHYHHHMIPPPPFPQPQPPEEMKQTPQTDGDKIITLAMPNPDIYVPKRKAETPAVYDSEQPPSNLEKKPKNGWSCALCQISATSERGLNEHFHGKKHKAKEAASRFQKIGLDTKEDRQTLQPCMTGGDINPTMVNVQKSQHIGGLEKQNETPTEEAGKINASKRRNIDYWCEICEIGTNSLVLMESHMNGKKHQKQMKKFSQNNGSAPPTSSVSQEAPGLIQDADVVVNKEIDQEITPAMNGDDVVVNKETDQKITPAMNADDVVVNKETDQKITPAMNEETAPTMAESFPDSDEVHPVAESKDGAGEEL